MSGRVIQGYFIGGRPLVVAAKPAVAQPAGQRVTLARPALGPPPAFAGRAPAVQAKPAPGRPPLVRQAAGVVQPFGGGDSFEIDPIQIGLTRGGGQPLPQAVLAKMEAAFGADFSAVRIHVGPQASRIGAVAFTMGDDLYFAPGKFQPDSAQGQQLIGHELAHVIQQRQGRVRAPGSGVAVVQDRALEAEADRLGMRAATMPGAPPKAQAPRGPYARPTSGFAVAQRRIIGVHPAFGVHGRLSGHDSTSNKRALTNKIHVRAAAGNVFNNFYEQRLHAQYGMAGGVPAANIIGGRLRANANAAAFGGMAGVDLAICHKMSSEEIQQRVAAAGNMPAPAFTALIHPLLQAIKVPAWAPAGSPFRTKAQTHLNNATAAAANQAVVANRTAANLTRLAGYIANSPVNFFIGNQTINASISNRGDLNTFPHPAPVPAPALIGAQLRRRRTFDSQQIYDALAAGPAWAAMLPVAASEGWAAGAGTHRSVWAAGVAGDLTPAVGHVAANNLMATDFHLSSSARLGPGPAQTGYVWG